MFSSVQVPAMLDRVPTSAIIPSGYKAIDAFFPLKVGHSCVISGEAGVGKSTIAQNVLAQMRSGGRRGPVVTVLALVGKRPNKIAAMVSALRKAGVLQSTVVVASAGACSRVRQLSLARDCSFVCWCLRSFVAWAGAYVTMTCSCIVLQPCSCCK